MGLPAQGCPDESALDHYVRGTGSAEQRAQVEGHLSACDLCTAITAAAARVATAGPSEGQVDGDLELPAASERYEWIEAVGHGAMGVVYAAFDQFLDRKVAIKVIRGDAAPKQASQRRSLLAESRALARVTHPNVVTVHDVGLNDGELFIAMEFVDGASLRAWLAAEARGRDEILDVFLAALAGLAAVHDAGLVHRDFKPDNVLVGRDGAVKVTDFGLVRGTGGLDLSATPGAVEVTQTLTGAGGIIGTPAYLAPELFDGAEATASSDQFACCVALFEALYGARPFDGPTMLALAEQVASGAIREPPGADVPAAIASVIRRGLAVDPDARHSSVGELAARLLEARRSPARRRRARLVLAAAATISVTGAVAVGAEAPVEACEGTEGVDPWATSDRAVVARALGNEVAPLFEQAVTRWADQWSAARRDVCRKTQRGERDASWRLRADACLDLQQGELAALLEAAAAAEGARAWRALDLARALPDPAACKDPEPAPPHTVEDDVAERLRAKVNAAANTGDLETVRENLDGLVAAAERAADSRLKARALTVAGRAAMEAGQRDEAAEILAAATQAAITADAPDAAARSLLDRIQLEAVWRGNAQQARAFAELARAHVEQTGDPRLRAQLEYTLGSAARRRDEYPQARQHCDKAAALLDPDTAPARVVAATQMCVADMNVRMGDLDQAEAIYRAVTEDIEARYGANHPVLAGLANGMGAVQFHRGDGAGAEASWREALRLSRLARGDDDPRTIGLLGNVATACAQQGKVDEERALLHEALPLVRQVHGERDPATSDFLSNLAASYLEAGETAEARRWLRDAIAALPDDEAYRLSRSSIIGNLGLSYLPDDPDQARPHLQRAVDLASEALGPEHEGVAIHLIALAEAELHAERPAVALPILRRVETIYAATDRPPPKRRARLALRLSQALFHTRAGIDEVRRLADRAERFVGESEDPRGRDELDAWLAFLAEQGR